MDKISVVTGAFGLVGRHIAQKLLACGTPVRTLTNKPREDSPFGRALGIQPLEFDRPAALTESLRGAAVLYNTYWVRFAHGDMTHERAVANSRLLFQCAAEAGVQRIVPISITNPSLDSPLTYFHGKAQVERALVDAGLSHAIL